MQFTEEDRIITAEQAKLRSEKGHEDSIVREKVREAMARIKYSSFYGYRKATVFNFVSDNYRPEEINKIREVMHSFGYEIEEVRETKTYGTVRAVHSHWTFSW